MFLCDKRVSTLQRSIVKNKYCKKRIKAKVEICMRLLKKKL